MDDVVSALYIAFSILVLVIALSLSMYMFSQITTTSELLAFYSDSTRFYDNIVLRKNDTYPDDVKNGLVRVISSETIVPTLYRYFKENFCVKIYDDSENLIQMFDVNTEGLVRDAVKNTDAKDDSIILNNRRDYAYKQIYNNWSTEASKQGYYMYGAPWLGSTDSVNQRINFFVNGKVGYINNNVVDYYIGNTQAHKFYDSLKSGQFYKERYICYSYSGATMSDDDGGILITGDAPKDKIVIIYTQINL